MIETKLYERSTWQPTERLFSLRMGNSLTMEDVIELYLVYRQGTEEYAQTPTLEDFGQWLSATGFHGGQQLAEVGW